MELTQQVSNLQDEVTLLKGEIKTVLKEMRTALLSNDNPFAAGPVPTFRAVGRAGGEDGESGAAESKPAEAPPEEPQAVTDKVPSTGPDWPSTPAGLPNAGPVPAPEPASAPTPLRPAQQDGGTPQSQPQAGKTDWNLLTIASLATWVEESLATLGSRRMALVLELACFAELISPDLRDVLKQMTETEPEQGGDRPSNVNDCLVVLRQLEAILQGEKVQRLPRRRARRRAR
jgi:hypothetical protein